MKLKSLEISGFKSFADKTVLSFGEGITAVVGPNGSGKSNISDAVRWVLGEQSNKALRNQKMENVIFSGTATRKQMGYAEVTLVIDNSDRNIVCDLDEISVTRRLYRSGESEYRINNASVRLKDVHELFMDTGLGRDGYSMVGQGKIDNIVASRTSEERRDIFEEAAGISRYRYRKSEAERKLNAAEENLVRLRDILSELESRVGPLKTQSEKAQKFLELSKEQEYLQIGLWMDNISDYKEQLRNQELKIISAREQYDDITHKSSQIDVELETATQDMQKLIVLADEARRNAASFEEKAVAIDGEINVVKNTIFHNNATIERVRNDIESISGGESDIYTEIESKKKLIDEKTISIGLLEKTLDDTNNQLLMLVNDSDKFSSEIEKLNAELNVLSVKVSDCLVKKMSAQSAYDELSVRMKSVKELIDFKNQKVDQLNDEMTKLNDDLKYCDEKIDECNNSLKGRQMLLESRQNKCNSLKEKMDSLHLDREEKLRRAQILEDLEKNMEGFGSAIKSIMNAKKIGRLKGVHGTVSNIISVKNEYSVAIEAALGNAIQNIVTDNENDAKNAIKMLKDSKEGRATFLPITSVKPRLFKENGLEDCDGYIGIADELVTYDKKYLNIISSLLGGIVVAEDIDFAVSIAKKYNYRFKIVTIDGQIVNAGGSMTGGSLKKHTGILSRINDINRLKDKANELDAQLKSVSSDYDKAFAELSEFEAEIVNSQSVLKTAQEDKIRVLGEIKRVSEQLDINRNDISQLESEKKQSDEKTNEFLKIISDSDNLINNVNEQSKGMKIELEKLTGGRDSTSIKRDELNQKANEIRTQIFEIKKDVEVFENSINELNFRISGQNEKTQQFNDEIKQLELRNTELEIIIKNYEQDAEKLREDAKKADESVQVYYSKRDELEKSTYEMRNEQKDIIESKERLNGELVRLEERKISMVHNYDEIIQKLFDEYGLTKTEAEERNIVIDDISQAKLRLAELKRNIKSLGNINVSAIEEYKEVSQRYEYMSEQIADVENTRDELYKLINQLVEQMKTLFVERFTSINAYFQKIFRELFGGGSAELKLTDPENVLECGIDILAQPPGKSISIIEQLSGGEKALIAISIYFAVMKVTPPPFCILDEVDAALDDVNVVRFAEYLSKMSERTQYIVITHRRGSMEQADVLYGVTMQEKGVTKLLKLNVSEIENNLENN